MRHETLVEQDGESCEPKAGAFDYLGKLQELGALEGRIGDREVSQEIGPVLEALHHVLAGGKVELRVSSPGNGKLVGELNRLFHRAIELSNKAERAAGSFVIPFIA